MKNKKGNADMAVFIITLVGLLIMAIVVLKIVNSILTPLGTQLNQTSIQAYENINYVHTTFVTFWDYLILIAMLVQIVLLFIFTFLADTNPVFIILYIIVGIIMLGLSPYAIEPVNQLFGMSEFSTEVLQLPLTNFVVTYFHMIIFSVYLITGIILYAKFRGRSSDL